MQKIIITFLILFNSCSNTSNIRKDISGIEFNNSEVKSIIIKEIEHSLLGGIINTKELNLTEKITFLNEIDNLEKKGKIKCKSNYIISVLLESDTLKFKYCNGLISKRKNDIYYSLKNSEEFNKILPVKPKSKDINTSVDKEYFHCDTLIGRWGIGNFYGTTGNVPPKIQFNKNGTGVIYFYRSNEKFKWECNEQNKTIKFESIDKDNSSLAPGNYIFTYRVSDKHKIYSLKFESDESLRLDIGRLK